MFGAVDDVTSSNPVVPALHQLHFHEVLNLLNPNTAVRGRIAAGVTHDLIGDRSHLFLNVAVDRLIFSQIQFCAERIEDRLVNQTRLKRNGSAISLTDNPF